MTYPKTILTRKTRLTILGILISSFFIISPILLLYTAGYRFDIKNFQLRPTGVLSIDAKPNDANIYLNNVEITQKMPIRLPNRAPGTYNLKIQKDGYKEWTKDIDIESNKTTYIKNITLFKDLLPTVLLSDAKKTWHKVLFSHDGKMAIILTQDEDIVEINLFDTDNNKTNSLARLKTDILPTVEWSPFANFIFIHIKNTNSNTLQLVNAKDTTQSKVYNFDQDIINWQWKKNSNNPTIFINENDSLKTLNTQTKDNINLFTSSSIWYVDDKNILYTYDRNENTLTVGKEKYSLDDNIKKIIDANTNRLIYQTADETKIFNLENNNEIKILPTQDLFYNNNTKELITWSPWELWTIYENGNVELLNRTGEKIEYVAQMDKYGLLLLANQNKITAFNPGYYISHNLLKDVDIKNLTVDYEIRKIYFWGILANKSGIFELEY